MIKIKLILILFLSLTMEVNATEGNSNSNYNGVDNEVFNPAGNAEIYASDGWICRDQDEQVLPSIASQEEDNTYEKDPTPPSADEEELSVELPENNKSAEGLNS